MTTKAELLKEIAPLKKIETEQKWYDLPLWTTLDKLEDVEIVDELIDPVAKKAKQVLSSLNPEEQQQTEQINNLSSLLT